MYESKKEDIQHCAHKWISKSDRVDKFEHVLCCGLKRNVSRIDLFSVRIEIVSSNNVARETDVILDYKAV